jgi:hypothetical protein
VQGLRHGAVQARAHQEPLQGLRHGLLPARAPEEPVYKDCGTGHSEHGRREGQYRDCHLLALALPVASGTGQGSLITPTSF